MCRAYNLSLTSPLKEDILWKLAKCYSKCIEKGNPLSNSFKWLFHMYVNYQPNFKEAQRSELEIIDNVIF